MSEMVSDSGSLSGFANSVPGLPAAEINHWHCQFTSHKTKVSIKHRATIKYITFKLKASDIG